MAMIVEVRRPCSRMARSRSREAMQGYAGADAQLREATALSAYVSSSG
jgi:hypothetical protein